MKSSKKELDDAETKLKNYQVKHKIFSTDNQMKSLAERITERGQGQGPEQTGYGNGQAALGSINDQLSGAGAALADSPSIQQAKNKLVDLETQKAGYTGKYTSENPKMKEINRQIGPPGTASGRKSRPSSPRRRPLPAASSRSSSVTSSPTRP